MSHEITVNNDWSIVIEHKTVRSRIFMGDLAVDDVVVTLVPLKILRNSEFSLFLLISTAQMTERIERPPLELLTRV